MVIIMIHNEDFTIYCLRERSMEGQQDTLRIALGCAVTKEK